MSLDHCMDLLPPAINPWFVEWRWSVVAVILYRWQPLVMSVACCQVIYLTEMSQLGVHIIASRLA